MSTDNMQKRVKRWQNRVDAANIQFEAWEMDYQTDKGYEYWLGRQWDPNKYEDISEKYTINLIFPTIESKRPAMLFFRPTPRVTPKPARADDLGSMMPEQARTMEDAARTFMWDRRTGFREETNLALTESFFRFGVVEVGYSADIIDNPNAGKPVLNEDDEEIIGESGNPVLQPDRIPTEESLYIKRIPAKQFRVSISNKNRLEHNDWCGYWDWVNISDVRADQRYRKTARNKIKGNGRTLETKYSGSMEDEINQDKPDMVMLWFVWDLRERKEYVWAKGADEFLIDGNPFPFLPFADLKLHEILDAYYPKPPVFDLISPQDEFNETRDMQKVHRRRYYRRYMSPKGLIDQDELEKLESGGDGVVIFTNGDPTKAIYPVPDADLSASVWRNIPATKDDFNTIAAMTGEARGVAEAQTATQANIIDVNAKIRDSYSQTLVGQWLSKIIWLMLETFRKKMSLGQLVMVGVDPNAPGAAMEAARLAENWKKIQFNDFGTLDFDVDVDITSLSPANDDLERQAWNAVLGLFANPALMMVMVFSDVILKKTLRLHGIRSDQEVTEIKNAMIMSLQAMAQQAAAAAAAKGGGSGAGPSGPPQLPATSGGTAPPSMPDVASALMSQMGRA